METAAPEHFSNSNFFLQLAKRYSMPLPSPYKHFWEIQTMRCGYALKNMLSSY